jgi:predicted unusual protein kinase regulating ubiquinone biosynthesis (AarF/ABC1/UbiB family)
MGQRVLNVFQDEETRKRALRRLHLENAERVVETMGVLKGAAMKIGQSLAVMADGLDLPPEAERVLARLQNKAQPVPFEIIRQDIEKSLENTLETLFSRFDAEPLGTASLGQAHGACLNDGTEVVVKVLHRNIEHTVDTDLAALKAMLLGGRFLRRDRTEVNEIFDEVKLRLSEELDYFHEAANLNFFRKALRHVDGLSVPGTHPSHCSDRVLTMDRLAGVNLEEFLETATPEARNRAGELLSIAFHESFYKIRALHADPHGGNFLFEPDGSVGLLDFGCVKQFDLYFVSTYAQLATAAIDGDRRGFMELARDIGSLHTTEPLAEDLLWEFIEALAPPFRSATYKAGGNQDSIMERVKSLGPRFLRYPGIRSPRDMVYLHRTLGGTYGMLRKLRYERDYGELFRRYSQHAIGVAEGRIEDTAPPPVGGI